MPFGSFAAAIYFAAFAIWFTAAAAAGGRGLLASAAAVALAVGLLTFGLLRRAAWARWVGAIAALVFGALALRRLLLGADGVTTMLALLAAPLVTLLLLVPFTGAADSSVEARPSRSWPAWGAALALGVALIAGWQQPTSSAVATKATAGRDALPAAARTATIDWHGLRDGLDRARSDDKPLLVTVETSWCPYCRKMQTVTWSAPEVANRLGAVVAVRIDAEDGADGSALAQRYGVRGFPTQLLLGQDGALIARADGFQDVRQFLGWFDGAIGGLDAIGTR